MNTRAEGVDRMAHPLFQTGGGGSIPTSALSLFFYACDRPTFVRCNRAWHSRLPLVGCSPFRVIYAAEVQGTIYAVAAWSNPVARLLPQLEFLELRRMAISDDAPKNTASRMLGWMTRDIRKRFPQVVRLISYQDCEAHTGTIYKASGWKHAENYISRKRGWKATTAWASRFRVGRTDQAVSPRMRWELSIGAVELALQEKEKV